MFDYGIPGPAIAYYTGLSSSSWGGEGAEVLGRLGWGQGLGSCLSVTIIYYAMLYYTILYSTLLYSTLLCYTILYNTILYYTILY